LGRAYAATGQTAKAADILRNVYVTMPLSAEAGQADIELKKLASTSHWRLGPNSRRSRADLLAKGSALVSGRRISRSPQCRRSG